MSARPNNFRCPVKLFSLVLFLFAAVALSGCGGDDAFTAPPNTSSGTGNGGGTTPTPSPPPSQSPGSGPPAHTIALSYPHTDSIENLGGGFYRRIGKALVTDADGHAVADGTIVQLSIIDSVIAQGTIAATDSIQGNTITDLDVLDGGGNPSLFTNANVIRNDAVRYIQPGDHIFLIFAQGEDKDRVVNINGITGTQIEVNARYSQDYPNADYPTGSTGYLIGASLLGAEISGEDMNGNPVSGYSVTQGGLATFHVTYPANVNTILSGCISNDSRALPAGSANVYMVATVTSQVTTVDPSFCFSAIAGGTLSATPNNITSSGNISVSYRDGGDGVLLPFAPLSVTVTNSNNSNITVNNSPNGTVAITTNENGYATFSVQVISPPDTGNATITIYSSGDSSVNPATVTVGSVAAPTPIP